MAAVQAQRTLVKSPPELWAEVSDLEALARHLGDFGEIRITRIEAERTVAWEGDRASGTVALEPSGWGTKVTLTAAVPEPERTENGEQRTEEPPAEPERLVEPDPEPEVPFMLTVRARMKRWFRGPELVVVEPEPEPQPEPEPAPQPEPEPEPDPGVLAVLHGVLDHLGSAHHRPFSRG